MQRLQRSRENKVVNKKLDYSNGTIGWEMCHKVDRKIETRCILQIVLNLETSTVEEPSSNTMNGGLLTAPKRKCWSGTTSEFIRLIYRQQLLYMKHANLFYSQLG